MIVTNESFLLLSWPNSNVLLHNCGLAKDGHGPMQPMWQLAEKNGKTLASWHPSRLERTASRAFGDSPVEKTSYTTKGLKNRHIYISYHIISYHIYSSYHISYIISYILYQMSYIIYHISYIIYHIIAQYSLLITHYTYRTCHMHSYIWTLSIHARLVCIRTLDWKFSGCCVAYSEIVSGISALYPAKKSGNFWHIFWLLTFVPALWHSFGCWGRVEEAPKWWYTPCRPF